MPRGCIEPKDGHGLLADTPANAAENARRKDEWLRCLSEYRRSPAYREWEVLNARHQAEMAARKKRRDRQRDRDRGADDNARRQRQRIAANARVPRTQQRRVVPRARNTMQMLALNKAEFDKAAALDIGTLGGCTECVEPGCSCIQRHLCTHCGALLFAGEAKQTNARGPFATMWEGGALCCSKGAVMLPPVERAEGIESMWRDPDQRKLLTTHSRRLNNALALASAHAKAGAVPGRDGWNPSVVIQGKLHHHIGPLRAADGATPLYAQLYINDPAASSDVVVDQRYARLRLPSSTSMPAQRRCKELLRALTRALHECNPYIQDILTAGEIFEMEAVPSAKFVIDAQQAPADRDKRTYSCNGQRRTFNEVTVYCDEQPEKRSILLRYRDGGVWETDETSRAYDTLHFILLFPCGDDGWRPYMPRRQVMATPATADGDNEDEAVDDRARESDGGGGGRRGKQIACREYYSFRLQIRACRDAQTGRERCDDVLNRAGRLFQEYCCMALAKTEAQRLRWHKENQKTIRAELYQNLADAVAEHDNNGGGDGLQAGKRVILASSFTGGPRDQHQRFLDGMAVVRRLHAPSLFVTMTCNPKWPEITRELDHEIGQTAQDRPDLTARVFRLKMAELLHELKTVGIFGRVIAYLHVIEFQHRGLPHAHILLILQQHIHSVDDIDECVTAELPIEPTRESHPNDFQAAHTRWKELCEAVCEFMTHGPCGHENPKAPCMQDGKCKKDYPKRYVAETRKPDDQIYPLYRRRSVAMGGQAYSYKGRIVDSRWIVPYSPYLLLKYRCHLNVEACISVAGIKYLYKVCALALPLAPIVSNCADAHSSYLSIRSMSIRGRTAQRLAFKESSSLRP